MASALALFAIQAARENARDGRFASTALPAENIAVRDAIAGNRIGESLLNVFLADQFVETLGTILPGDDLIHGMLLWRSEILPDPG